MVSLLDVSLVSGHIHGFFIRWFHLLACAFMVSLLVGFTCLREHSRFLDKMVSFVSVHSHSFFIKWFHLLACAFIVSLLYGFTC